MSTPEEHAEILRLVRESHELAEKNNKLLKTLYRHNVMGFTVRVVWYVILLGLPFALYFTILEPYFAVLGSNYETFRAGIAEIPGLKGMEHLLLFFEHGGSGPAGQ